MTNSCSSSSRSHDAVHVPHHRRGRDEKGREREGLKVGRSERSRATWAAVKGRNAGDEIGGCRTFAVNPLE